MDKISWYLKGVGAYGWRYWLTELLIKAFYKLYLVDEQTAIHYAKCLHDMWMMEIAKKAGLRVVNVKIWCEKETTTEKKSLQGESVCQKE